ncbi:MAG TPA: hypothetical protein VJB93_00190 [Patescibacteria group bacterium]|nr:hypothetical protein [Patescibacteria group bacterium]
MAFEQKRIRVTLDTQTLGYDALSGQTIDLRDLGQEIETLQEEETMGDLTPHEAHQRLIKKFHELRPVHPTTTGNIKGKIQPVWDEYPSFVQGLLEVPGEPGRVLLRAMQEAGCVGFRGDKVLVLTTPVSSEESKLTPKVGDVLPVILPDMVQWAVLNGEGAGKGVRRVTREDLQEEIDHHTQVYGISREGLVAELAHLSVLTLEGEGETYLFSIKAAKATLTGATSSTTQSSAEDDNVLLLADSEEDDDASDEGGGNLGGSGDDDEFSLVIEMAIESARQATGVAKSDPAPIHWKGGSVWQVLVDLMDGDLLKTRSAMARFYREGYITVAGGVRVFLETPDPAKSGDTHVSDERYAKLAEPIRSLAMDMADELHSTQEIRNGVWIVPPADFMGLISRLRRDSDPSPLEIMNALIDAEILSVEGKSDRVTVPADILKAEQEAEAALAQGGDCPPQTQSEMVTAKRRPRVADGPIPGVRKDVWDAVVALGSNNADFRVENARKVLEAQVGKGWMTIQPSLVALENLGLITRFSGGGSGPIGIVIHSEVLARYLGESGAIVHVAEIKEEEVHVEPLLPRVEGIDDILSPYASPEPVFQRMEEHGEEEVLPPSSDVLGDEDFQRIEKVLRVIAVAVHTEGMSVRLRLLTLLHECGAFQNGVRASQVAAVLKTVADQIKPSIPTTVGDQLVVLATLGQGADQVLAQLHKLLVQFAGLATFIAKGEHPEEIPAKMIEFLNG